jgi:hypothetical protein
MRRFERRVDRTYPLMNDTGLHVWLDCGHRGIYQGPLKDLPKVVYCDKCRWESVFRRRAADGLAQSAG